MSNKYLLGVDIGTYSSKGVLVDIEGLVIDSFTVQHSVDMPKPGYFEHDAEKVWWHDYVVIVKNILANSGVDPEKIEGIGVSGIGSCVLPIDSQGRPLRPAILYGIDTRAMREVEYLKKVLGKHKIFQNNEVKLTSQSSGPKILWIKNNEPDVYKKTRWFLTSQAYLVYKLTNVPSIDIYTAGGYAPLYDVNNFSWLEDTAEYITPTSRLPKSYWSCEVVGRVTSEAARETGLAKDTPVITGTTDAASEAVSAGVANFGDMMLMLGSSIFFIMKTPDLVKTENFWYSNFLEKGTYAFMGGMSTSGSLTTWFRDQFAQVEIEKEKSGGQEVYSALAQLAAESPEGAKGLVALPYFEGERTPLHDPKAKGILFGLSLNTTRKDIYRAILESVGFGIRHNLEVMKEEGVTPKRVLAVGGGTKNPVWMQIISDINNVELVIPEQQIGASYGDAFMAGVGVGLFKSINEVNHWIKIKQVLKPNLKTHHNYSFNYKIFRNLYKHNKSLMHELSDFLIKQSI